MTKKSKLREKPSRFTTPYDETLKPGLEKYLREISGANNETAKALRFSMLLGEWFADVRPTFIEDYLRGVEKYVKVEKKDFILRGHIDALYGNAVIEFEGDLKRKLKEAKEQLQEYVYCLLGNEEERHINYLCIASDGILFSVYTPEWGGPDSLPSSPEDIILRELDKIDFTTIDAKQAFLWLDRYFFRKIELSPTTEEFVKDFGINSPAYAFAIKLLRHEWKQVSEKDEFQVIYENWEKYLRIAYGTSVADTELFLRHTYLGTFVRLLAFMRFNQKPAIPTTKDVEEIFTGRFFQKLGIQNFLEEDFLSWVAREKVRDTLVVLVQRISTLLEKYHLEELSEDVLKSLYQELVDPRDRHDLGEYYTPDWLADRIVRRVLEENPRVSVLDPSCGSGSFLYFAIKYKREQLGDRLETLYHIRDTVVGVDIHPLAVTIAKTNYLLALGELVKKRPKDLNIPVYMADSLRLPEQLGQTSMFEKVLSFRVELDHKEVPIPEVFTEQPAAFDEAINACEKFGKEQPYAGFDVKHFTHFANKAITEVKVDEHTAEVLFNVAERLRELIRAQRNSIWAFILKNVYKPIFLKKKFDWVIGNPPWLSYRYVEKGQYQEFLRRKILEEYCLLQKGSGHLITHLELGTLFFCACLQEYGIKKEGQIAFVLPRSVFTSDQHDSFRKASFGKSIYQIGITEIWDLEKVAPLFNVPACVVFGKRPHFTKKPISAQIVRGNLPRRNTPLLEASSLLTAKKTSLYVIKQGERSFWSEDPKAQLIGASPYGSKFAEGATIVPRSCWFVDILSEGPLGFDPSKPYVRTDPRATHEAKEAYKNLILGGNIEKDFLYATLLSTDLVPFGFLDFRTVVLPIKSSGDNFTMITAEQAKKNDHQHLATWLEKGEKEWKNRRKEKAGKMTIYQRLDHVRGLTQQSHKSKYKVVYPMSATNLCSAVVENKKIVKRISGQRLELKGFVADYKLFFYETEKEHEAHYLAAILNSPTIDELIKPMQSRGLWGPRDICMKVWELPIPAYNASKGNHRELAELGMRCAEKVKKILPGLETKDITPGKIGRLRNEVRKRLADELSEIDGLVKAIMKK
jgi:methylase of polypeptide subunit release factors